MTFEEAERYVSIIRYMNGWRFSIYEPRDESWGKYRLEASLVIPGLGVWAVHMNENQFAYFGLSGKEEKLAIVDAIEILIKGVEDEARSSILRVDDWRGEF